LKEGDAACVACEDLQPRGQHAEQHDIEQRGALDQQLQRRAHRAEVDQIGNQQQADDADRNEFTPGSKVVARCTYRTGSILGT
jgi:hypothetical protein